MSAKSAPPCSTLTISSCRSCWGWGKDTYYQVYCGGASSITAVGPVAENVQPEFPSPILLLHVIRPFPACLGAHNGTNTAAVGRRILANARAVHLPATTLWTQSRPTFIHSAPRFRHSRDRTRLSCPFIANTNDKGSSHRRGLWLWKLVCLFLDNVARPTSLNTPADSRSCVLA